MEKGSSAEHEIKATKRQKKTPLQINMLEKAYAENKHPSEAARADLSVKLGLTSRQTQMWFCNRRLKDKKENQYELETQFVHRRDEKFSLSKRALFYEYPAAVLASKVEDDASFGRTARQRIAREVEKHSLQCGRKRRKAEMSSKKLLEKSHSVEPYIDLQATAIAITSVWGETFREDGPILGFHFDPLPPSAFDLPIELVRYSSSIPPVKHARTVPFGGHNNSAACGGNGSRRCCYLKSPVESVLCDRQLLLATRKHDESLKPGTSCKVGQIKSCDPSHIRCQDMERAASEHPTKKLVDVRGALKRPSRLLPTKETVCPPKRPLPLSIKTYVKQDQSGFGSKLENGGEATLFPAKCARNNLHLTLMR